jgi:hypothetical protein
MERAVLEQIYINALIQKAELCNSRFHQAGLWFVGVAAVGYFLSKSTAATLTILGESVTVPRTVLVATMPLLLAALFYSISCFMALEGEHYSEIKRFVGALEPNHEVLSRFQLRLLEAPSHYTYGELREIAGSARLFLVAGTFAYFLVLLLYALIPVTVVGYFVILAFRTFGFSWVLVLVSLCFLDCLAFYNFLRPLEKKTNEANRGRF